DRGRFDRRPDSAWSSGLVAVQRDHPRPVESGQQFEEGPEGLSTRGLSVLKAAAADRYKRPARPSLPAEAPTDAPIYHLSRASARWRHERSTNTQSGVLCRKGQVGWTARPRRRRMVDMLRSLPMR